jgi:dTDP-glucose 4,6-dehydratase
VQVSTDEVYGALGPDDSPFTEESPLRPRNPYSASKAAADHLGLAYVHTYGFPLVLTRCGNNFGPYQFPEKLIPLLISNALDDRPIPVYGDGLQVRDWIHVYDHCSAIDCVREKGRAGAVYNIGARGEKANLDLVRTVLRILGKPESLIRFVEDRPGHDRRYGMDARRLGEELGWRPESRFEDALADTVRWYIDHRPWWEAVRSGAYLEYYDRQYGKRLGGDG